MLKTTEASKGLLFGSFLYRSDLFSKEDLAKVWEENYGPSFSLIPSINPLNDYYKKEMGEPLARFFLLTTSEYHRDVLLSAKLLSLNWENNWANENKRSVNVDVGFLSLENFLLATTKNYSHRVYIGQDIFADLTYFFPQGRIEAFPWTYPDYLDSQKKDFFLWGRSFLLGLKK